MYELKKLLGTRTAIRCYTKEEAIELLKMLKSLNYGFYHKKTTAFEWDGNQDLTCYNLKNKELFYSRKEYYEEKGYAIINFNELIKLSSLNIRFSYEEELQIIKSELETYEDTIQKIKKLEKKKQELEDIINDKDYVLYCKLRDKFENINLNKNVNLYEKPKPKFKKKKKMVFLTPKEKNDLVQDFTDLMMMPKAIKQNIVKKLAKKYNQAESTVYKLVRN